MNFSAKIYAIFVANASKAEESKTKKDKDFIRSLYPSQMDTPVHTGGQTYIALRTGGSQPHAGHLCSHHSNSPSPRLAFHCEQQVPDVILIKRHVILTRAETALA
jgi:hypothetical protein